MPLGAAEATPGAMFGKEIAKGEGFRQVVREMKETQGGLMLLRRIGPHCVSSIP